MIVRCRCPDTLNEAMQIITEEENITYFQNGTEDKDRIFCRNSQRQQNNRQSHQFTPRTFYNQQYYTPRNQNFQTNQPDSVQTRNVNKTHPCCYQSGFLRRNARRRNNVEQILISTTNNDRLRTLPYIIIPETNVKFLIDTGSTRSFINPVIAYKNFSKNIKKGLPLLVYSIKRKSKIV